MTIDAQTIRAFVDDELPPLERAAVERSAASDQELAARIAFERMLRIRTGRIMSSSAAAPAELRDSIQEMMQSEQPRRATGGRNEPVAGRIGGGQPRIRVNPWAVAACLAIVCGAVLVGLFGTPIDQIRRHDDPARTAAALIAEQAVGEHMRCRGLGQMLERNVVRRDPAGVERRLTELFGMPAPVFNFREANYDFIGLAESRYEVAQRTLTTPHLIYRHAATGGLVSVMIVPAEPLGLARSTDRIFTPAPDCCVMSDGVLAYAVVSCDLNIHESLIDLMRRQLNLR